MQTLRTKEVSQLLGDMMSKDQEVDMVMFLTLCQRVTDLEEDMAVVRRMESFPRPKKRPNPFHDTTGCPLDCKCGCLICKCDPGTKV